MPLFDIQWNPKGDEWVSIGTGTFTTARAGLDRAASMLTQGSEKVYGQHVEFDPKDLRLVPIRSEQP
jgi:hypothetical protein